MADTLDPKHIDKRTAERYLRSGQIDEKTYEKLRRRACRTWPRRRSRSRPRCTDEDFDDEDDGRGDDEADESDEDSETA